MDDRDPRSEVGQPLPEAVLAFWQDFAASATLDRGSRMYEFFAFGDNENLAEELTRLVLAGSKRATASSLWEYEADSKPPPKSGSLSVVTNWQGEPLCVIESTCVDIVPFDEVTEEFAAEEGEGDGLLASWREGHTAYFRRVCQRLGREFEATMPVVCERFKVIYQPTGRRADSID